MTVLALRLAGPMQAWGASSRFVRRTTLPAPTKSGVLGLLAAAQGLRRTDPLEELLRLKLGLRIDQQGRLVRDFQTARSLDGKRTMPLSWRFYLADAVFLAVVEGDTSLLESLDDALRHPVYPLYLGRRSCPPAGPVTLGLRDGTVHEALEAEPWRASPWYQRRCAAAEVHLETVVDADPGEPGSDVQRDVPLSFDPRRRDYGWRSVRHGTVTVLNPSHAASTRATGHVHEPFAALGG